MFYTFSPRNHPKPWGRWIQFDGCKWVVSTTNYRKIPPNKNLHWAFIKHRLKWMRSPYGRAPHGQRPWISSESTWWHFPVPAGRRGGGNRSIRSCLVFGDEMFWKVGVELFMCTLTYLWRRVEVGGSVSFLQKAHFGNGEVFQILTKHSSWRGHTPALLAMFELVGWTPFAGMQPYQPVRRSPFWGRVGKMVGWLVGWLVLEPKQLQNFIQNLRVWDFLQQLEIPFGVKPGRWQMTVLNPGWSLDSFFLTSWTGKNLVFEGSMLERWASWSGGEGPRGDATHGYWKEFVMVPSFPG